MKIRTLEEQIIIKNGLSTTWLKAAALIAMTADHIGKNLPFLLPPWLEIALQILGRCAAPLFAYAVVIGMQHTAHPWRYALRMYAFSWVLLLGNAVLEAAIPTSPVGFYLPNDVFLTYAVLIVFLIGLRGVRDFLRSHRFSRDLGIALTLLIAAVSLSRLLPQSLLRMAFLPWPPLDLDYGYLIPLGCVWFFCKSTKTKSLVYGIFCLGMLANTLWRGSESGNLLWFLFVVDYQWTMILALPIMYLYNGQRGTGHKWFFYAYYLLHSWLLYAAGIALSQIV